MKGQSSSSLDFPLHVCPFPHSSLLPHTPPKPVGSSHPEAITTNALICLLMCLLQTDSKLLEDRDLIVFAFVTLGPRSVPGPEEVGIRVFDE